VLLTRLERPDEVSRAADREPISELEKMLIARDDDRFLALGQRKQIVVAGVAGAARRRGRVWRMDGGLVEERDEFGGVLRRYSRPQLRIGERTFEFGQQAFGDDELEVASQPTREDLRRRPARGEQSRNENVGVEDSSHSAPTTPSLVLSLDRERGRLFLGQIVPSPETVEQVEPKLAPKRLFDDFAVALAGPRTANLDRAEDFLLDRQRRADLRHIRIIASPCIGTRASALRAKSFRLPGPLAR
jgi:hypothetical protein